jgi:hypothetical protein
MHVYCNQRNAAARTDYSATATYTEPNLGHARRCSEGALYPPPLPAHHMTVNGRVRGGGKRKRSVRARFIHKFRRAAAARGPEVASTSSIPAIQVGQCERDEWGAARLVYVSHTPQPERL